MADSEETEEKGERAASGGPSQAAATQVREAGKWLIASLGAVAAVLAAGIQFGDVGKLEGGDRIEALIAAAVGFIGVGVAIYLIADILIPRARSVSVLANAGRNDRVVKWLGRSPEVLLPFDSVEELAETQRNDRRLYRDAFLAWRADPTPETAAEVKQLATIAAASDQVADRVVGWGNYQSLNFDFSKALGWSAVASVVAVAGLTGFALKVSDEVTSGGLSLRGAALARADLQSSDLGAADLTNAKLNGANLTGANLVDADLSGADLAGANLSSADLEGAEVNSATNLSGVTYSATTCPDGTDSDDAAGTCDAHLRLEGDDEG